MADAMSANHRDAFILTAEFSLLTALIGAVLGLVLAWALHVGRKPQWLNSLVNSFTALASLSDV
ncbi:hypothetical protein [Corynebacterium cystitidis]|uniref:hypothetical protein n=1 Tax=Corynebacterium cystitidis TaxID=35757 RepID=UPI00211E3283|nr:hypothetical protein [Corynebacterium cystitidis]